MVSSLPPEGGSWFAQLYKKIKRIKNINLEWYIFKLRIVCLRIYFFKFYDHISTFV